MLSEHLIQVTQVRAPNRLHDRRYFYKYVTAGVVNIVLATRRVRWSSPLLFNDPFDITQELRLNFDEALLNGAIAEEMARMIERSPSHGPKIRHPLLNALLAMLDGRPDLRTEIATGLRDLSHPPSQGQVHALEDLRQMWRDLVPTMRVLCLSELHDVTSMWNHYSDNYRGVVLEFEAVDEIDSCLLVARPVVYQDQPPAIADAEQWARCMLGTSPKTYNDLFTD